MDLSLDSDRCLIGQYRIARKNSGMGWFSIFLGRAPLLRAFNLLTFYSIVYWGWLFEDIYLSRYIGCAWGQWLLGFWGNVWFAVDEKSESCARVIWGVGLGKSRGLRSRRVLA